MTVEQIQSLQPRLRTFLSQFSDCFSRREPASHLESFVRGQLSDLPRKSLEPIALHASTAPRTLQKFFATARWDEDRLREQLQRRIAQAHAHPQAIGSIDETSHLKKGHQSPGVQPQHCCVSGRVDNCIVTVHLAYSRPDHFRTLLDGELFLPEKWSKDRDRCRQAGIPDPMVYRPKWKIALELLDRAAANGVAFAFVNFDEGYGCCKQFHLDLQERRQPYVGEVPCNFRGFATPPAFYSDPPTLCRGRHWRNDNAPTPLEVRQIVAEDSQFTQQPWQRFVVKDTHKGPIVWEAKVGRLYLHREDTGGLSKALKLIVARNVLEEQTKYMIGHDDVPEQETAALGTLLGVGLGRYPVERCFEDQKTELGLSHFESRNYRSLKRHLLITCVSSLFLAEAHQELRGEKSAPDGVPGAYGGQCVDHLAVDGGVFSPALPAEGVAALAVSSET